MDFESHRRVCPADRDRTGGRGAGGSNQGTLRRRGHHGLSLAGGVHEADHDGDQQAHDDQATGARDESVLRTFRTVGTTLLVVSTLTLAACAAGPNNVAHASTTHIAGFWFGLWHGVISPVTFIVSLFNQHVNIYEVHNNGAWYNFGFMLGVSVVFGCLHGSSRAARRQPAKRREADR